MNSVHNLVGRQSQYVEKNVFIKLEQLIIPRKFVITVTYWDSFSYYIGRNGLPHICRGWHEALNLGIWFGAFQEWIALSVENTNRKKQITSYISSVYILNGLNIFENKLIFWDLWLCFKTFSNNKKHIFYSIKIFWISVWYLYFSLLAGYAGYELKAMFLLLTLFMNELIIKKISPTS